MYNAPKITKELFADHFNRAFRSFVGVHRKYRPSDIAEDLNIDIRTVRSWMNDSNVPQATYLIQLCGYLGTDFTNRILSIIGQTGVYQKDGDPITINELQSHLVNTTAIIATAMEDNIIDHKETIEINDKITSLVSVCNNFTTHGKVIKEQA